MFNPIAQSFIIQRPEAGISGVFITTIGVYFQSKDSTGGVTLFIVETQGGYPDISRVVARSRVESSGVTVSSDASEETRFLLTTPFYATAGQTYAFVIQPDGNSPDYQIWASEVGGIDINTQENVYSNPYAGVLFISANMNTWTAVQKEDLKFNIYRAMFAVGTAPATFINEADEYIVTSGFTRTNPATAIEVGDVVFTSNSTFGANTSTNAPRGIIQYIDESIGELYLDQSNASGSGRFAVGNNISIYRVSNPANTALMTAPNRIATGTIATLKNLSYHAVVPRFAAIQPAGTSLEYGYMGTDTSYTVDSSYKSIVAETETEYLDKTRIIMSRSNEIADLSAAKSGRFQINFSTTSGYVSPVIDLTRKSTLFIENVINNDITNEDTKYGAATTRYISKNIVLADGQEAEDLMVYVTAYRPVDTNIYVYAKFYNSSDSETLDSKKWTLLSYLNNSNLTFSNPTNRGDIYEYEFGVPSTAPVTNAAYLSAADSGILHYTNVGGADFAGYKIFALKIVLTSSNAVRVPILNDVRAIALQI